MNEDLQSLLCLAIFVGGFLLGHSKKSLGWLHREHRARMKAIDDEHKAAIKAIDERYRYAMAKSVTEHEAICAKRREIEAEMVGDDRHAFARAAFDMIARQRDSGRPN